MYIIIIMYIFFCVFKQLIFLIVQGWQLFQNMSRDMAILQCVNYADQYLLNILRLSCFLMKLWSHMLITFTMHNLESCIMDVLMWAYL